MICRMETEAESRINLNFAGTAFFERGRQRDREAERQKRSVTKMHWIPPPVSVHKATSKTVPVSLLLAVLRDRAEHPQLIHATQVCFVSRLQ